VTIILAKNKANNERSHDLCFAHHIAEQRQWVVRGMAAFSILIFRPPVSCFAGLVRSIPRTRINAKAVADEFVGHSEVPIALRYFGATGLAQMQP
jgi:hypothetical protein